MINIIIIKKIKEPTWVRDKTRQIRFKRKYPLVVKIFNCWRKLQDADNLRATKVRFKNIFTTWKNYKDRIIDQQKKSQY